MSQPRDESASGPVTAHEIFKHKGFLFFQAARFFGTLGLQMQAVAVGWQVYALTQKALDLGLVGLSIFVPFICLSLVAGDVADRFDRRRIVVCFYVALAICAVALWLLSFRQHQTVLPIYMVLAVIGAARAFGGSAASALLPHLVPVHIFGRAVAWSSSVWQIATIVGPALGGLVYGLGGPRLVYLCCAIFLALAFFFLLFVRVRVVSNSLSAAGTSTLKRIVAGIQFVRHKKIVLGAISLDLFAVLFGGAVALLPIYARDILHVGPMGLGVLRSAPAVGATAIAILLAYRPLRSKVGVKMFLSVGIFGVATCVFALSTSFALSFLALLVTGAADMVSVVVRESFIQLSTPDEMRGRVSAVNMVFIGASNELGEFESGVTAAWLGTVPAVIIGGIGTILVVLIWAKIFPSLRKAETMAGEAL